jgi:CRP/FNR family transcriptional regulator
LQEYKIKFDSEKRRQGMAERTPVERSPTSRPPTFAAAASEDLLAGGRLLRQAFLEAPLRSAPRDTTIITAGDRGPPALFIQHGLAYSSHTFTDGRRAIIDLILPSDVVGIEHAVLGRSNHDIVAASGLAYRKLSVDKLGQLMANPQVASRMLALVAETRWRGDGLVTALSRLHACERMACFLLGIYERLRRAQLISRPTFSLQLTQEQIGDHLGMTTVHVSRTLRSLRQDKVALVDHQVVIIIDVERLRAIATCQRLTTAAANWVEEGSSIGVDAHPTFLLGGSS